MVADPATIWLGLEYFCGEGDDLWSMDNGRFIDFAAAELEKIGLIDRRDVIDGTLVRVPKAYPAYFGTYGEFDTLRVYLDRVLKSLSRSAETACTATTIRIIPCWRPAARSAR